MFSVGNLATHTHIMILVAKIQDKIHQCWSQLQRLKRTEIAARVPETDDYNFLWQSIQEAQAELTAASFIVDQLVCLQDSEEKPVVPSFTVRNTYGMCNNLSEDCNYSAPFVLAYRVTKEKLGFYHTLCAAHFESYKQRYPNDTWTALGTVTDRED